MVTRRLAAVFLVLAMLAPAPAGAAAALPGQARMSAPAAGPLSKRAFADRFVAALKGAAPELTVEARSVEDFDIILPDKSKAQIYLGNAYQDYLADPETLEEIIGRMVRLAVSAGQDQPVEPAQLRVLLRPDTYTALDPKVQDTTDKRQVSRPFAGDLFAIIGADQPESIMFPPRADIIDLVPGGEPALWALALANTRQALAGVRIRDLEGGLQMVQAESLAGGLLLDEAFWSRPELAGKGDLVVLVLKDAVLIVHEGNADGIGRLRDYIAEELAANRGLISRDLLVRRNGSWEVLRR